MSQIAKKKFPCTMLSGGLSVNLNHLKTRKLWEYKVLKVDPFLCASIKSLIPLKVWKQCSQIQTMQLSYLQLIHWSWLKKSSDKISSLTNVPCCSVQIKYRGSPAYFGLCLVKISTFWHIKIYLGSFWYISIDQNLKMVEVVSPPVPDPSTTFLDPQDVNP